MARPTKENLEYFSHDTDMRRDKKIALGIADSPDSMKLFGTYNALLENIYHEKYYIEFSEEDATLFCHPFNDMDVEIFWDIMEVLLKRKLFSAELYEKYGILTSRSIQERWLKGCERRKEVTMYEDHILIDDVENFIETQLGKNYQGNKLKVTILKNGASKDTETNNKVIEDNKESEAEPEVEDQEPVEKYDLQCDYMWKESEAQPIDYKAVVEYWNRVNGAQSRMTNPKKTDIKRALRTYSGMEIARALYVRAKDENIGKYRTQWSTFFGQKTLQKMDKWVDKAQNLKMKERSFNSKHDFLDNGWYLQRDAEKIAEDSGMDLEDSVFWDVKSMEGSMLYYPKFDV